MIWQCFGAGAVALAVRTTGQAADLNLPEASFFAALAVATAERLLQQFHPTHGSILSLVGCIPMVPGSIAAKSLMNFFALLRTHPTEEILAAANGMKNLLEVTFTLAAIGTALAIPRLIFPRKMPHLS
jgi:uncharacterized membrane protein YjjB (DUF3815 family)